MPQQQTDLFPEQPVQNYRHTDPVASKSAGLDAVRSGRAAKQRDEVLRLVRAYPGRTSKELGRLARDMDRYAVARRLPELLRMGQVGRIKDGECIWTVEEGQA